MNLKLIVPKWPSIGPLVPPFPPLALAIVAAHTPRDVKIHIVDENVEEIDFDEGVVDLVGITAFTIQAKRAYEIADEFRKRGAKVVMGGIHSSSMPDEALKHADVVVIGEAEGVWEKVVEDFKTENLRRIYKAPKRPSLANLSSPRWKLINRDAYIYKNIVQTTRGCPHNCSFCTVPLVFGKAVRHRPVEEVVKEIKELIKGKSGFDRFVYFLDDNTGLPPAYGKALFKALVPLKIKWMAETSVRIADDDELLELAEKSGCVCLMLGFESLSARNLADLEKTFFGSEKYEKAIRRIHKYGIAVWGFFILGLDLDDQKVFEETVRWAQRNCIEFSQFAPLIHHPKTRIYEKDKDQLTNEKWWLTTAPYAIDYAPELMSREALEKGLAWATKRYYSPRFIISRLIRSPKTMIQMLPVVLRMKNSIRYISRLDGTVFRVYLHLSNLCSRRTRAIK